MTARVFVPLVGADGTGQQLFEALAGPTPPDEHPAQLTPQISELYDFGLYRIGQVAREAVARFAEQRRRAVWLGRRNARLAPWHLRISDLQVGRLSDGNARSAGLGLTLAALLQTFGRPHGVVFATGEILMPQAPGSVGPVAVGPVDGIRGKLLLVGDYLHQHRAALAGSAVTVVLPAAAVDGRPLAAAETRTIERLREAATGSGIALRVVFLETLDGLEDVFGPFAAAPVVGPKLAAAVAGSLLLTGALVAGWTSLRNAPVSLAWLPVEAGASDPLPRRAVYRPDADRIELRPACFDAQRQPLVRGGESLVFRVSAGADDGLSAYVAPPRFFIVSVSRAADPIVLDASLFRTAGSTARPGSLDDAIAAIPIEATDDEVRLFVVATRDADADLSGLAAELRDRLAGLDGAAALATTAQYLSDRFDGQIDYQFKVTTDATLCPD